MREWNLSTGPGDGSSKVGGCFGKLLLSDFLSSHQLIDLLFNFEPWRLLCFSLLVLERYDQRRLPLLVLELSLAMDVSSLSISVLCTMI